MTEPEQGGAGHPHPPDWSSADSVLESEIQQQEQEIKQEEHAIRTNRMLVVLALALVGLTVAALVMSIIALNRDIDAVAKAEPKPNSVSTGSIKNGAVTQPKIAAGAVDASRVANNALTGAQINEATLAAVPSATKAVTADDAVKLGGVAAANYISGVKNVQASTGATSATLKGPIVATCPSGTRVLGGGAEVQGARNVAIIESTPSGTTGWSAIAAVQSGSAPSWGLIVTAICGG